MDSARTETTLHDLVATAVAENGVRGGDTDIVKGYVAVTVRCTTLVLV